MITMLRSVVLVAVAFPGHSFFLSTVRTPNGYTLRPLTPSTSTSTASRCSRKCGANSSTAVRMASGQGGGRGKARGRGRGGRGGKGKRKGKTNQGSLIPGPPRLEVVPQEKLDQIFLFKEERPGRYMVWIMPPCCTLYSTPHCVLFFL